MAGGSSGASSGDTDEKYQFMMDTLSEGPSLQEQLMEQLIMVNLNPQEQAIAELLIGNIDDEGYLQLDLDEIMDRPNFPIDLFEKVLSVVQSFEPAGIGARDLKECLLLQLERSNEREGEAYQLVQLHIELWT